MRRLWAQALGLRPWLAALPLRERRLRARLLMGVTPSVGCGAQGARVRSHSRTGGLVLRTWQLVLQNAAICAGIVGGDTKIVWLRPVVVGAVDVHEYL